MAASAPQTRENHVRYHPPFHFFFSPAVLLLLLVSLYEAIHSPGLASISAVLLVIVVGTVGYLARTYALKVQDRVIRLEEQLRLSGLLEEDYFATIRALSEPQLIALRFASDEEVAALARRAAEEQLSPQSIKEQITDWRPDTWRV
jgi:uncharacterized membrane protein YraQ (UPF0718 family)